MIICGFSRSVEAAMTNPGSDSGHIDAIATHFCAALTSEWARPYEEALAKWSASDLVDNPDPLRLHDANRLMFREPDRTFRYGMPPLRLPARPHLAVVVSPNLSSAYRTPADQALQVVNHRSHVCWGAHMSNKARHVLPKVDGVAFTDGKRFAAALGQNFPEFVTLWKKTLRTCGLRDASGGQDWYTTPEFSDELHIELPGAKLPQTDPQVIACVDEYIRLINAGVGSRDAKMERHMQPHLKARLSNLR
jgi:hypothetical protein